VQNDFVDPAGSLYVGDGEGVVAPVNELVDRAVEAGAPVFYTQDWHPASTPHFVTGGGVWPEHCVAGSWGAELHPSLRVAGEVVRKGTAGEDGYSGFSVRDPRSGDVTATALGRLLEDAGVASVVVVGVAGDVCVRATALDARRLGYPPTVVPAAVRFVEREAGDAAAALEEMAAAGVTVAG
jgi:nicotinamidase/pyrazinamidase